MSSQHLDTASLAISCAEDFEGRSASRVKANAGIDSMFVHDSRRGHRAIVSMATAATLRLVINFFLYDNCQTTNTTPIVVAANFNIQLLGELRVAGCIPFLNRGAARARPYLRRERKPALALTYLCPSSKHPPSSPIDDNHDCRADPVPRGYRSRVGFTAAPPHARAQARKHSCAQLLREHRDKCASETEAALAKQLESSRQEAEARAGGARTNLEDGVNDTLSAVGAGGAVEAADGRAPVRVQGRGLRGLPHPSLRRRLRVLRRGGQREIGRAHV